MENFKAVAAVSLLSVLAITGCQKAEAVLPVDLGIGYVDNSIIDEEGVEVKVGTELNKFRLGLNSFTTDNRIESLGGYLGVPIYVQNTNLALTPQIRVERYFDLKETTGGVGLGVEYKITDSVRLEGVALANRSFDNSDIKGEIYTVGLTKTF